MSIYVSKEINITFEQSSKYELVEFRMEKWMLKDKYSWILKG